jgi:hypothetical protein
LAVGWPAGNNSDIWYLEGPRDIEIVLPAGRRVSYTFSICQVQREGELVRGIALLSRAQQLETAYSQARKLSAEWGLGGREGLDAWRDKRRRDGVGDRDPDGQNWRADGPRGAFPRYGVAVLCTFRSDIPWTVQWGVVFAPPIR